LKISKVGLISKEGQAEAKEVARDVAELLLDAGFAVTSFPNLHSKRIEHAPSVKGLRRSNLDLIVTVSGDGTILNLLRILDSSTPCLCINVGGRGILAEIKPDQAKMAIDKISKGDFHVERRLRLHSEIDANVHPPALNEIYLTRQSVSKTPAFTIDFGGSVFTQRMDGLIISTSTGSTGHSYSYGSPFMEGSLNVFALTPIASLDGFPTIITTGPKIRVMANFAIHLVIDGQETFSVEANKYVTFSRHERDAVFLRFDRAGAYRQLRNLGFR
jgi:NAD+ kinase